MYIYNNMKVIYIYIYIYICIYIRICMLYIYIYVYIYIYTCYIYIHVIYKSEISNASTICNIYKSERELTIPVGLSIT